MFVELLPRRQRKESVSEIAAKLRPQLNRFPGIRATVYRGLERPRSPV